MGKVPGSASGAPAPRAPGDAADLPERERAELNRQGAKAAARGDDAAANPLQRPENKPAATGEPADAWHARKRAWQQGHSAQSSARRVAPSHEPTEAEDDPSE